MKQYLSKATPFLIAALLSAPVCALAQNEGNKTPEKPKDKQRIIITENANNNGKVVIEINGDQVTVNGKPLADYKSTDSDFTVRVQKIKEMKDRMEVMNERMRNMNEKMPFDFNDDGEPFAFNTPNENHAMLGVVTEKNDKGAGIQEVTKESAAEKAGLKQNDIITKVDDEKISDPDALMKAIQKHKSGDKVYITYLRDNKEQKTTAELKKSNTYSYSFNTPGRSYNFNYDGENFNNKMWQDQLHNELRSLPRMQTFPRNFNQGWTMNERPKLGLSVQDTDDGKGVKVVDVDDESNAAKAGIKQDDIITEMDGKAVNSADEAAKIMRDSRDKKTMMVKLTRGGKSQNVEVKIPHNLKTTDL
jgi:serine protease Do